MLNNKGFTLIEVLVAIVIVSIGLLAVAGMQNTAIYGNASSRDATYAVQLAEEMIDRVRVNSGDTPEIYNCIDTNNSGVSAVDATPCATSGRPSSNPAQGDYDQWRSRLQTSGLSGATGTVMVLTDNPINKTATIEVTVTWGSMSTRSITFTTIIETWLT